MLHLAELQRGGRENGRPPDNGSEEAVKTAEKPNALETQERRLSQ